MPVTLPLEVYEALERGLGKEDAKRVIHGLETTISEATEYKWATTKEELLNAIRREFVTRELFEERMNALRADLEGKIENVRVDLTGEIEKHIMRLDRKFTVMFIVLFFTIVFLNQNALEFLAKVLGVIK